jgi:hypothetical protein
MNRAACLASLLVFVSLPAIADDRSQIAAAVRGVVEQKASEEKKSDSDSLLVRVIDAIASDDGEAPPLPREYRRKPSDIRSQSYGRGDTSGESLRLATCPFGTSGTKTYDELRYFYRDHTDDELWKLCLNRDTAIDLNSGACACALLASPQPWRPVATPHSLEREEKDEVREPAQR